MSQRMMTLDGEWHDVVEPPLERLYWHTDGFGGYLPPEPARRLVEASDANLVSSLTRGGLHAPALDIDYPARLVPSKTEGHFHLYLDREMPWPDYWRLLKVMYRTGLLEDGFVAMSLRRGMSYLRYPADTKS